MVSLRAYNREIEQLIDNGRYDEAIAHCKHILQSYPKYIEVYRNLGKTLLEAKRYPEARDIFARVISVFPDDFISHVGLSIIAEDQRDLDLAIWHMERAFDVQPSNIAIQDELKRLFSRRDGASPQKIRLSRGALVRMYARGELYTQAITEINNIQLEDPKRFELDVLLAKMKYRSGAIDETIAICSQILAKNPFCYEANQIMLELHTAKKEHEQAILFKNRLVSLDPYYRFITDSHSTVDVPENKIEIEKLLYIPDAQDSTVPSWLQTENSTFAPSSEQDLDWLKEINGEPRSGVPIFMESSTLEPSVSADSEMVTDSEPFTSSDDLVPDWMKNAGWQTVPTDLQSGSMDQAGNDSEAVSISQDTPDWLIPVDANQERNSNPDNPTDANTLPVEKVNESVNSELSPDSLNPFFETKEEANMDTNDSLGNNDQSNSENTSDWLRQFAATPGESNSPDDQDLPDWLKNFDQDKKIPQEDADEIPDWLKNLQDEGEPGDIEPEPASNTIIEPVDSSQNDFDQEVPVLEEKPLEQSDEVLPNEELFKEITSDQPQTALEIDAISEQNEPLSIENESQNNTESDADDIIPDWVKSVLNSTPQETLPQAGEVDLETPVEHAVEIPKPETIEPATSVLVAEPSIEEGGISQQTNDELLEWLRGLKAEDEKSDAQLVNQALDDTLADDVLGTSLDRLEEITGSAALPVEDFTTELGSVEDQQTTKIEPESTPGEATFVQEFVPVSTTSEVESEPSLEETIPTLPELTIHQQLTNEISLESNQDLLVQELLKDKPYEEVPAMINGLVKSGNAFSDLLTAFEQVHAQDVEDFRYWQCLGDIYAKRDQLSDALAAYQKAEDVLVRKISN